jgi:hypothetical protein
MASDFPVTIATELDAGAELDVLAGVPFAALVVAAEVVAEDTAIAELVLMLVAVLDATDMLVDVVVAVVAGAVDVLAGAVLDTLVSPCTGPVPEASWYGDSKH